MKKVLRALIIVFACIFIFSVIMIFRYYNNNRIDIETFEEIYELATEKEGITSQSIVDKTEEEIQSIDIKALQEINPDCVAWISIDGTVINYPIMYTPDTPNKYLRRNFYGQDSRSGTPFIQDGSSLEGDNVIIHAHNMLSGTMFAGLKKYLDKPFFDSHPSIVLQTVDETHEFTVLALAQMKDDDIWYSYTVENDQNDFEYLTSNLLSTSVYTSDIKLEFGDRFITLSTCYGRKDEDRLILVGISKKSA